MSLQQLCKQPSVELVTLWKELNAEHEWMPDLNRIVGAAKSKWQKWERSGKKPVELDDSDICFHTWKVFKDTARTFKVDRTLNAERAQNHYINYFLKAFQNELCDVEEEMKGQTYDPAWRRTYRAKDKSYIKDQKERIFWALARESFYQNLDQCDGNMHTYILLKHVGDATMEEIAASLGMSVSTIKRRYLHNLDFKKVVEYMKTKIKRTNMDLPESTLRSAVFGLRVFNRFSEGMIAKLLCMDLLQVEHLLNECMVSTINGYGEDREKIFFSAETLTR